MCVCVHLVINDFEQISVCVCVCVREREHLVINNLEEVRENLMHPDRATERQRRQDLT